MGGISSGRNYWCWPLLLKPTASTTTPGKTININREDTDVLTKGRHDPCVGVRAAPIAEAMLAIVLMDHFLRHRAQNADVVAPFAPIEYSKFSLYLREYTLKSRLRSDFLFAYES